MKIATSLITDWPFYLPQPSPARPAPPPHSDVAGRDRGSDDSPGGEPWGGLLSRGRPAGRPTTSQENDSGTRATDKRSGSQRQKGLSHMETYYRRRSHPLAVRLAAAVFEDALRLILPRWEKRKLAKWVAW